MVVVNFYPVDSTDRGDRDMTPPVGELLVAIFVVQAGIAPPGRFQSVRKRCSSSRGDQRRADVLALRLRRIDLLIDSGQQPAGAEDYLHLLVGELLDVVDRENGVRLPATVAYPRGEQRLLGRWRVPGVPVYQRPALAEGVGGRAGASRHCSTAPPWRCAPARWRC